MGNLSNKEIAMVHVAAKAVGIDKAADPDLYKATLLTHGGAESASLLTRQGYSRLMKHFEKCGFESRWKRKRAYKGRPKNMDKSRIGRDGQLQKIEALLTIGKRPWSYADALAKRICKIDRIAWVPTDELYKVIAALRYQAKREDWELRN